MILNLSNKRAIVCGSTQGIGKAIALEFAKAGASVTLVARDEHKLQELLYELSVSDSQQHEYLVADFSKPELLREKLSAYVQRISVNHILVNNTGGPPPGPITEARAEDFLSSLNQHLICNHLLVQAVLPGMKQTSYGRIINIISTSVRQPIPNLGVSNTTRGAVASWAKTLSREVAPFGITVNNILPGATRTGRLEAIVQRQSEKQQKTADEVEEEMLLEIPARRFGTPEEIAATALFLASDKAGYINGTSIPVDGGRLACL